MTKYSTIYCNQCYKRLTEKEASVYSLQWQYSGDMYCAKCRSCPDDCRRTPCLLSVQKQERMSR